MSARRQLEQGDSLSQRTLRWRQVTQLRCLAAAFAVKDALGVAVACFSASENGADAPVAADIVAFATERVLFLDQGPREQSSIGLRRGCVCLRGLCSLRCLEGPKCRRELSSMRPRRFEPLFVVSDDFAA